MPSSWTIWVSVWDERSYRDERGRQGRLCFYAYSDRGEARFRGEGSSAQRWRGPYEFKKGEARNLAHAKRLAIKACREEYLSAAPRGEGRDE